MKRFIQSYLTLAVGLIVVANLVLVLLYGRQFAFKAAEITEPSVASSSLLTDFLLTNIFLVGLLLVIWFILTRVARVQSR